MWIVLLDNTVELVSGNTYGRFLYSGVAVFILVFIYLSRRAGVKAGQIKTTAVRLSLGKGRSNVVEVDYLLFSLIILVSLFFLGWKGEVSSENKFKEDRAALLTEIAKYESEPCISGIPSDSFWKKSFDDKTDRIITFRDGRDFEIDGSGSNTYCFDPQYFSFRLAGNLRNQFTEEKIGQIKICSLERFSAIKPISFNDKCVYKIEVEIID